MKNILLTCLFLWVVVASTRAQTHQNLNDSLVTVIQISDTHLSSYGDNKKRIDSFIQHICALRLKPTEYFDARDVDGASIAIKPQLVFLTGDIDANRATSIKNDSSTFYRLYLNHILFVAAPGNHDWEPKLYTGDSTWGYDPDGNESNKSTDSLVYWTYQQSKKIDTSFNYVAIPAKEVFANNLAAGQPVLFFSNFKHISFINTGVFLYEPCCTKLSDEFKHPAVFINNNKAIGLLGRLISSDKNKTAIFFQHYPFTTTDDWWDDYGTTGLSLQERKARYLTLMKHYPHAGFFAGHEHEFRTTTLLKQPAIVETLVEDCKNQGAALAILISPTRGVLEIKKIFLR